MTPSARSKSVSQMSPTPGKPLILLFLATAGGAFVIRPLCLSAPLRSAPPVAKQSPEPDFLARLFAGARAFRNPFEPPPPPPPPKSRYVPPEEWIDTETDKQIAWEKRVRFEAMRGGNGIRQNEILGREIGKG